MSSLATVSDHERDVHYTPEMISVFFILLQSFVLTRISTPALHADAAGLLKVSKHIPPVSNIMTPIFLPFCCVVSIHRGTPTCAGCITGTMD